MCEEISAILGIAVTTICKAYAGNVATKNFRRYKAKVGNIDNVVACPKGNVNVVLSLVLPRTCARVLI